ncbi:hypothetical protein SD71_10770 [Cohnella kolymensis]|uniref:Uncharacterized protein n=1 Tax=Cohnella kolymensis TaxID=1590652 RepID=A0ABR5A485_9BACL|nr:hypothetical protein [Cohnella kolymensis]KIL35865.1 hypothetical protein SD71_10770 [Cohnella kolymensis]
MEQLFQKLAEAGLIDDSGNIVLERYPDGTYQAVDKQIFNTFFGDVAENPTYEALMGTHTFMWGDPPQQLTYTAAQLGYQKYFYQWKEFGIL